MTRATLTCPKCQHKQKSETPDNTCLSSYKCEHCGETIKAKEGDCCVLCSHADISHSTSDNQDPALAKHCC